MCGARRLGFASILAASLAAAVSAGPPAAEPRPKPRLSAMLGVVEYGATALSPDGRFAAIAGPEAVVLWDAARGRELARLGPLVAPVTTVAFSPEGRAILVADGVGAHLFDVATHARQRSFPHGAAPHARAVAAFAGPTRLVVAGRNSLDVWSVEGAKQRTVPLAPGEPRVLATPSDGAWAATASSDGPGQVIDLATGGLRATFEVEDVGVLGIAASPDGAWIATGSTDGRIRTWRAADGRIEATFGTREHTEVLAFSPDGRRLLTGTAAPPEDERDEEEAPMAEPASARLWDVRSGRLLRRLPVGGTNDMPEHDVEVTGVAFAADGKRALIGAVYASAVLVSTEDGSRLASFEPPATQVTSVAVSPDGKRLAIGRGDGRVRVFDLEGGRPFAPMRLTLGVYGLQFLPDSHQLFATTDDEAVVWDVATGRVLRRLPAALTQPGVPKAEVSWLRATRLLDGGASVVVADLRGGTWRVEVSSGKVLRGYTAHAEPVVAVCASPDASRLVTAGEDGTVVVHDLRSGASLTRLEGPAEPVAACFVGGGAAFAIAGRTGDVRVFDVASGNLLRRLGDAQEDARVYQLLSDASGATLWIVGERTRALTTATWEPTGFPPEALSAVALAADGRHLVSDAGLDSHGVRIASLEGAPQLYLFDLRDGTWAVVDPQGRYDASDGGIVPGLHWAAGNETVELSQLKSRYYEPGLLPRTLGFAAEPLREVGALEGLDLFPEVRVSLEGTSVVIRLKNRGGGIGPVVLKVNGKEWTGDARPAGADAHAAEIVARVELAGDPRFVGGVANRVEVEAFNAEGYLRSRGLLLDVEGPPAPGASRAAELWAVIAGVSDYAGAALDLRYPAKDATDFATGLSLAAEALFGRDHVHLALLADAARADLVSAFEAAARGARPTDVLVFYLAGHGVTRGGVDGDFYYLTREAASDDLADPAVRSSVAISSGQIVDLVNRIPAGKQVLVLDTCASGALVRALTKARAVPSSQVRALERLKDRTGIHVLAGCAADRVSYEATRFGQGLLTYSLLLGMRGAALREREYLDVDRLFAFASDTVPELAKDVGGVQRPVVATPTGGQSFDLGRLTAEGRARVPLQRVRPVLLPSRFQDETAFADVLGLGAALDRALADASASDAQAGFVFVDADDLPDGLRLVGRYRSDGARVAVTARLHGAGASEETIQMEGTADALESLAARLLTAARQRLPRGG